MNRWSVLIGVAAGLLVGSAIVVWLRAGVSGNLDGSPARPLAEDVGRITRVVMQYSPGTGLADPGVGQAVSDVYRQFLSAAGSDVQVLWVARNQADLDDLKGRLGDVYPAGSQAVLTEKPITTWSKDRFTCLGRHEPGRTVLLAPKRGVVANPLRTNDQEVPWRLELDFPRLFECRDLDIDFDGGDVLATSCGLFIHPAIFAKNPPATSSYPSADVLGEHLRGQFGELTRLGPDPANVPPHHVGMFLTIAGGVAFVGDVELAERLTADRQAELGSACQAAGGPADAATRADLMRQLNRVADQMRSLGLAVVRVPLMPSATDRAWMSYNNGIVETRAGRTVFYMPAFGMKRLDDAAREIYRAAGCRVVPIDCSRVWHLGGSLHCLVNVVGRGEGN